MWTVWPSRWFTNAKTAFVIGALGFILALWMASYDAWQNFQQTTLWNVRISETKGCFPKMRSRGRVIFVKEWNILRYATDKLIIANIKTGSWSHMSYCRFCCTLAQTVFWFFLKVWQFLLKLEIRGEFNKFVELGIFLYNSRFLFSFLCSVNLCQLNDNSRSVNTYIFCSYYLFENLYPQAKMESQNIEFRAVIKFLTKEGAKAKEIHRPMADLYGDSSPKYSTVAKWSAEFKRGQDSLEDDPRPGRPADFISQEMIHRVERLVLNNRWIKVAKLASECGISNGRVYTIIHEYLGMSKVSARWVHRNLDMQDHQQRVESSQELLEVYKANPEDFHTRLVTGDETLLHHWDSDTKKESIQWKHPGSPPPKKFCTQPSASKVMAMVFWDSKGLYW